MNILQNLKESDPIISNLINSEKNRQETHLELIASENFASMAVMQAQGSVLTNKYAEGLPQKRYYGGCEFVDEIEELAINSRCVSCLFFSELIKLDMIGSLSLRF